MRVWLELGRVSNLPTVWTNALAGMALAGSVLSPVPIGLLLLAMTCMYVGGMFLNDAFDRQIDARERPTRPIPSGRVAARTVFGVGFGLLALGVALSVGAAMTAGRVEPLWPGLAALGLAGVIVVYDMHHKGNPLSPLIMGLCRVGIYLTAGLCVRATVGVEQWWGMASLLGYLIGLTYAAKQESLNRIGRLWPLLFLAAPFFAVHVLSMPMARGAYLALLVWVVWTLRGLMGAQRNVGAAVTRFLAGLCLLDGIWLGTTGQPVLVLACAAAFVATRLLQRVIAGT